MRKLEKVMLAAINQTPHYITNATNWATHEVTGAWTNDKLMRRIYAVVDLADRGEIVRHEYDATYHGKAHECLECRNEREESTPALEGRIIKLDLTEGN